MTEPQAEAVNAAPASPTRWHPLAQYLLALTTVVGAYFAYLRMAVPYLEPIPQHVVGVGEYSLSDLIAPPIDKSKLVPLLPEAAWELGDCKSLLTESGTILFQSLVELPDGAIEVKPFTLVAGLGERDLVAPPAAPWRATGVEPKNNDVPTVLRCQAGAKLTFDKPLRQAVQGSAKLQLARLVGEVEIFRPPTTENRSDEMYVYTHNVQVEADRIYTLDQVQIFYGRHRALGRNLRIDLKHRQDTAPGHKDFSTINGIHRLELAFLDHLRIEPTEQSNHLQTSHSQVGGMLDQNQSPIEVRCQGPFLFDFDGQVASFQDQVVATQLDQHQNNIHCDRLELEFASPDDDSDVSNAKAGSSAPATDVARLKRLVASGSPAVVMVNSQPTKIIGRRLSYDAQTRQFEGQADAEDDPVTLVSTKHQIVARHLRYTLTADGSLGPIYSEGPGRLLQTGDRPEDEIFVRWSRRLMSQNDPAQPQLQSIVLDGNASIRAQQTMDVAADRITFHLRQWQDAAKQWQFSPAQVVAVGDVQVNGDRLQGTTGKLTASWRTQPGLQARSRPALRVSQPTQTWTRYRIPQEGTAAAPVVQEPKAKTRKLKFHGREMELVLRSENQESKLEELTLLGNVEVTEFEGQGAQRRQTMSAGGSFLRVIPQAKPDQYRIKVAAEVEQAHLETEKFRLTGQVINFDQQANKAWVEGAGSIRLEQDGAELALASATEDQALPGSDGPAQMHVQWDGGMIFDGQKIYFERRVRLTTQREAETQTHETRATSEALSVELDRYFNLSQDRPGEGVVAADQKAPASSVDVRELIFVRSLADSVRVFPNQAQRAPGQEPTLRIENRVLGADGQLRETQQLTAQRATIDGQQGTLVAEGPGYLALHRLAEDDTQSANPLSRFAPTNPGQGWTLVRINFEDQMEMVSGKRQMEIDGRVRMVYRPVADAHVMIDPDAVGRDDPAAVTMTCQHLELAQWQPRGAAQPESEMTAIGNVKINSQRLRSTASRVSYRQSADTLIIEGSPRSDANLWYRQSPQQVQDTHVVAKAIRYRISNSNIELSGVQDASGSARK